MKTFLKKTTLLLALTVFMLTASNILSVTSHFMTIHSNQAVLADKDGDKAEEKAPCYDDPMHIPATDIDIPTQLFTNPLQWFVCSTGEMLTEVIQTLNSILQRLLLFDPTMTKDSAQPVYKPYCETENGPDCASTVGVKDEDSVNQLRKIWGNFLALSNIILVIGFLIMVISTALDMGIFSNYTVKKMLPRIIIAAIGANLSWSICALVIKMVNFIGLGVYGFMTAPFESGLKAVVNTAGASAGVGEIGGGIAGGATSYGLAGLLFAAIGVLMFVIVASGGVILLPILMIVGTVVGIALLVILLRRIVLTLLVVVAPLAFIAWALPGGENLFKKWWKTFLQMALVFPLSMVLFASGVVVATISGSVGTGIATDGTFDSIATMIITLLCLVVPYALIPTTLKLSKGIIGNLAGIADNKSKGLIDRARNKRDNTSAWGRGKKARKEATEQRHSAAAQRKFNTRMGKEGKLGDLRRQRVYGGGKGVMAGMTKKGREDNRNLAAALGADAQKKQREQEMGIGNAKIDEEARNQNWTHGELIDNLKKKATDKSLSEGERSAALDQLVSQKDFGAVQEVQDKILKSGDQSLMTMNNEMVGRRWGDLKSGGAHTAVEITRGNGIPEGQEGHIPPTDATSLTAARIKSVQGTQSAQLRTNKPDTFKFLGAEAPALANRVVGDLERDPTLAPDVSREARVNADIGAAPIEEIRLAAATAANASAPQAERNAAQQIIVNHEAPALQTAARVMRAEHASTAASAQSAPAGSISAQKQVEQANELAAEISHVERVLAKQTNQTQQPPPQNTAQQQPQQKPAPRTQGGGGSGTSGPSTPPPASNPGSN